MQKQINFILFVNNYNNKLLLNIRRIRSVNRFVLVITKVIAASLVIEFG